MPQMTTQGYDYSGLPKAFVSKSRERAKRIRHLDVEAGRNFIEMGKLLAEQRDAFGSAAEKSQLRATETWTAWIQRELGWQSGRNYANSLIKVFETFGDADNDTMSAVGYEKMKLLSSGPAAPVREKILENIRKGEPVPTIPEIRQMKRDAGVTKPSPSDAKAMAKETGEVQVASDGKYYTPMPEAEEEAYEDRRDQTYDTMDAISAIAKLNITPKTWLAEADRHWLNDFSLGEVEKAAEWLRGLASEYRKQNKVVDQDGH